MIAIKNMFRNAGVRWTILGAFALATTSCAPESPVGTFAGLDRDYVLSTAEPAFANTMPVRLRYEDDWVPRTCEGITYLSEQDTIVIEWRCLYRTGPGTTVPRPGTFTGGLTDPDGDGTYTGTMIGFPLTDANTLATDPVAAQFTMTPCDENGGSGPCTE